jgi:hypothetical protein
MKFQIRAPNRAGEVDWALAPTIDGAAGPTRCHEEGVKLACELRKTGPITIRGSLTEPGGACVAATVVSIRDSGLREGESFFKRPWGCPGSDAPEPPKVSAILRFRAEEVLDPDLAGEHAAQVAKARRLRRAWIEEVPVERWSEVAWGSPLDATDARLLARRGHAIEQAGQLIRAWLARHPHLNTYAGWTWGADGSIYIGFTKEPNAVVARMKKGLPFLEPAWVKSFPSPPVYTEEELMTAQGEVSRYLQSLGRRAPYVPTMDIDFLANEVEVKAIHPGKVRRLLTAKFGAEAPIEVVKGYPIVF